MNFKLLAASILLATTISPFAHAGITWNPDGVPGGLPTVQLGAFDWNQSSFVARDGNTAIANFIANQTDGGTRDTSFQVYTHAQLAGANGLNNNLLDLPGLGNTFEYTLVMGFYENVTFVANIPGIIEQASFVSDFTRPSFLEIYYDASPDSDALTGSGFNNGQLILRAELGQNAGGQFALSQVNTGFVDLDQSPNGNDYTGQTTRVGSGSQENLVWNVLEQDFAFFKDPIDALGINFSNISIGLPFNEVDPSDCFTQNTRAALGFYASDTECDTNHVNGVLNPATQPLSPGYFGYVPNVSPANTILPANGQGNPDFIAQTDFNSSFSSTPVPEPTGLLMIGAGLLGLFRVASRKAAA